MIPNWKLRLAVFAVLAVPLTYLGYCFGQGAGLCPTIIGSLFGFGMACIVLFAAEPDHFPDRLARTFTTVEEVPQGLQISFNWKNGFLTLIPLVPLLISTSSAGLFCHSLFPNRPTLENYFTVLGIVCLLGLILVLHLCFSGLRCCVWSGHVVKVWTYFGRDMLIREYGDVQIVEYSLTNGSAGGPVVKISYKKSDGNLGLTKLNFRNVYGYSREEFGELLAEYLGEPEIKTFAPTRR